MNINRLLIENYKSLLHVEIINPAPFSVFVGPNASGKSNIFEAIHFAVTLSQYYGAETVRAIGNFIPYNNEDLLPNFKVRFDDFESAYTIQRFDSKHKAFSFVHHNLMQTGQDIPGFGNPGYNQTASYNQFFRGFSRIFIKNDDLDRLKYTDDFKLSSAGRNLASVLKRVLQDDQKRESITEWLQLLIPGFERIEIVSDELGGTDSLRVYESGTTKPFSENLISDGTFNIIAILTAVYQSDGPQFLCIDEPENGLNPKVIKELVSFFRNQCQKHGHYIWLNTHSQTLVRELTTEEIIIVDKLNGETKIKQIQGENLHGLPMDEALLTNAIGGGIPW